MLIPRCFRGKGGEKAYLLFATSFILINIISFASMFITLQCGLIIDIYALVFLLLVHNLSVREKSYTHQLFELFVVFELLSIPISLLSPFGNFLISNPIIFLYGVSYILIPQLFFYKIGIAVTDTRKAVSFLLKCNFFLVLMSVVFYVARPNFYISLISSKFPSTFELYGGFVPRLVGYIADSMAMGVICSSSFVLSLAYIKKNKYLYMFIFLIGSIMSMQRGSWIMLVVSSFIYLFLSQKLKQLSIRGLFFIVVFICSILYIVVNIDVDGALSYTDLLLRRFENLGSAGGERDMQWLGVIDAVKTYPIGFGLGALSHKGVNMGFPLSCPDGNYFRILGDTGVMGLIIFVFLNVSTIFFLLRRKQYGCMCALLVFLAQAVGTNVFDLYYSSFIYWFLMGASSRIRTKICSSPSEIQGCVEINNKLVVL